MKKKLLLIQLNELNFDLIKNYFRSNNLDNLKKINNNIIKTYSEAKYNLLEPWIQWYSIYTGLSAKQHKVFRLGDVEKHKINHNQIFEAVEKKGFSVGCVAPMNAKNKLRSPKYFISDPWTKTKDVGDFFTKITSRTISEFVNNNSSSIVSIKSYLWLILIFFKFVRIKKYFLFLKYFLNSINKTWFKSIFLDALIHEIHMNLLHREKADFSTVFFNAGAHIQHHYLFNSIFYKNKNEKNPSWYLENKSDPIQDVAIAYNSIFKDYFNLLDEKRYDLIICTALSQSSNLRKEFYYRLNNHFDFLHNIGVNCKKVSTRMSRDFLVEFKNAKDLNNGSKIISNIKLNKKSFFKVFEKKDNTLFVSLIYSSEIKKNDNLKLENKKIYLKNQVSFVAIKNGKHSSRGYLYMSDLVKKNNKRLRNNFNIIKIFDLIVDYFNKPLSKS
jgi:hypothetical protein